MIVWSPWGIAGLVLSCLSLCISVPQLVGHVTRVRRDHKIRNPDSQSLSFRATLMALLRGDAARVGATESAPSTSAAATEPHQSHRRHAPPEYAV